MAENITSFPLHWPAGWKRAKARTNGRFSKRERTYSADGHQSWSQSKSLAVADAVARVLSSLSMLGADLDRIIISTNIEPRLDGLPRSGKEYAKRGGFLDPGVAVYWSTKANPKQKCMAIDRYESVADNIAAIAASLDAMRAIERHGGAEILERVFLGFQSLSPPIFGGRPWRDVLGLSYSDAAWNKISAAEDRYRELAKLRHPDNGGSAEQMAELNDAIRQAREELK